MIPSKIREGRIVVSACLFSLDGRIVEAGPKTVQRLGRDVDRGYAGELQGGGSRAATAMCFRGQVGYILAVQGVLIST